MTILRIETTEIPAQVIETAVISIPANEWQSMRTKSILTGIGSLASVICFFFVLTYDITSDFVPSLIARVFDVPITGKVLAASLACLFFSLFLTGWATCKFLRHAICSHDELLNRHGWDHKSKYRVELEYQQFLHE